MGSTEPLPSAVLSAALSALPSAEETLTSLLSLQEEVNSLTHLLKESTALVEEGQCEKKSLQEQLHELRRENNHLQEQLIQLKESHHIEIAEIQEKNGLLQIDLSSVTRKFQEISDALDQHTSAASASGPGPASGPASGSDSPRGAGAGLGLGGIGRSVLKPLSPRTSTRIEKLQAMVRGFLARATTKKIKIHHAAKASGVLIAMKKTIQGETGWYVGPDGSVYYFVLDEGEWILTCGPIAREMFDEVIASFKPLQKTLSSQNSFQERPTSASSTSSGGRGGGGAGAGGLLRKVEFELIAHSIDLHGELYMSPLTWRLHYVLSIDTLMIESK
jgi:hypothetical protein